MFIIWMETFIRQKYNWYELHTLFFIITLEEEEEKKKTVGIDEKVTKIYDTCTLLFTFFLCLFIGIREVSIFVSSRVFKDSFFFRSVGFAYCFLINVRFEYLSDPTFDTVWIFVSDQCLFLDWLFVNELTGIIEFLPKLYVIK